jgi:hypothetical protein
MQCLYTVPNIYMYSGCPLFTGSALGAFALTNAVSLVRDRSLSVKLVPTFADREVSHGQCGGSPTAVISLF